MKNLTITTNATLDDLDEKREATVVTHNGKFHADEVLAIALLVVFNKKEYNIIRTRNNELINEALTVIDAGEKYENKTNSYFSENYITDVLGIKTHVEGFFDHHQFEKDHEDYGLSSAGLIWRTLKTGHRSHNNHGRRIPINHIVVKTAYPKIDSLVHEVDEQDVGIKRNEIFHFSNIIESLNGTNLGSANDKNFMVALKFTIKMIKKIKEKEELKKHHLTVSENVIVKNYNDITFGLVSEWIPIGLMINKVDFIVYFDNLQNKWTVQQVPLIKGEFGGKYNLTPTKDEDEFTHKGGFIGKYIERKKHIYINIEEKDISINLEELLVSSK